MLRVDPAGLTTYPKLKAHKSCKCYNGFSTFLHEAERYVQQIVDKLSLGRCRPVIEIKCYNKKDTKECGKAYLGDNHMHINMAPQCSNPKCLILHELIHACGMAGHGGHKRIEIPGCGRRDGFWDGPTPPP